MKVKDNDQMQCSSNNEVDANHVQLWSIPKLRLYHGVDEVDHVSSANLRRHRTKSSRINVWGLHTRHHLQSL